MGAGIFLLSEAAPRRDFFPEIDRRDSDSRNRSQQRPHVGGAKPNGGSRKTEARLADTRNYVPREVDQSWPPNQPRTAPQLARNTAQAVGRLDGVWRFRRDRPPILRRVGTAAAVSPRASASARARRDGEAGVKTAMRHTGFRLLGARERTGDESVGRKPEAGRGYFVSGDWKRSRLRSSWPRNISPRAASHGASTSSRAVQSYHGNTLGALADGASLAAANPTRDAVARVKPVRRSLPIVKGTRVESEADCRAAVGPTRSDVQRLGPDTVAAFLGRAGGGATPDGAGAGR